MSFRLSSPLPHGPLFEILVQASPEQMSKLCSLNSTAAELCRQQNLWELKYKRLLERNSDDYTNIYNYYKELEPKVDWFKLFRMLHSVLYPSAAISLVTYHLFNKVKFKNSPNNATSYRKAYQTLIFPTINATSEDAIACAQKAADLRIEPFYSAINKYKEGLIVDELFGQDYNYVFYNSAFINTGNTDKTGLTLYVRYDQNTRVETPFTIPGQNEEDIYDTLAFLLNHIDIFNESVMSYTGNILNHIFYLYHENTVETFYTRKLWSSKDVMDILFSAPSPIIMYALPTPLFNCPIEIPSLRSGLPQPSQELIRKQQQLERISRLRRAQRQSPQLPLPPPPTIKFLRTLPLSSRPQRPPPLRPSLTLYNLSERR